MPGHRRERGRELRADPLDLWLEIRRIDAHAPTLMHPRPGAEGPGRAPPASGFWIRPATRRGGAPGERPLHPVSDPPRDPAGGLAATVDPSWHVRVCRAHERAEHALPGSILGRAGVSGPPLLIRPGAAGLSERAAKIFTMPQAQGRILGGCALALISAAALAACGSTAKVVTNHGPSAHTTGSSHAPGAATDSGKTSTAATAATPQCTAAMLKLSFLGGSAATGHGLLVFALTNTSASSCRSYGFPGVQFISSSGAPLPTDPTHTTQDFFGSAPERPITLAHGQSASFRLGTTDQPSGADKCATAAALQVIPPNDTHTLRTAITGGAYECTAVTVSPLEPGRAAFP